MYSRDLIEKEERTSYVQVANFFRVGISSVRRWTKGCLFRRHHSLVEIQENPGGFGIHLSIHETVNLHPTIIIVFVTK